MTQSKNKLTTTSGVKKTTKSTSSAKSEPVVTEKTPAEKELENRKTVAMVIGAVSAFLAVHFLARPLLNSFGMKVEWWIYLIAIFIGIGYATKLTTKDMANEAMALQKKGEIK